VPFTSQSEQHDKKLLAIIPVSVILASFGYHATMRDKKFLRADEINNGRRWYK
tara:strand:- start:290 stop:448 length:159 start_codon:yes stop_codon:yes gene_type:complete